MVNKKIIEGLQEGVPAEEVEYWNKFLDKFGMKVDRLTKGEALLLKLIKENYENCQSCISALDCKNEGVVTVPLITKSGRVVDNHFICMEYVTSKARHELAELAAESPEAENVLRKAEDFLGKERFSFSYKECQNALDLIHKAIKK